MHFSFIHTADIHLDSPFKGLHHLPKRMRDQIAKSTERAFEDLVTYAIENEVDFIIIAGDIYDQVNRSVKAQLFFQSCLKRLEQEAIMIYMVHGNHDPLQNETKIVELPQNTVLFPADNVGSHIHKKSGEAIAQIYGISYASKREERRLASKYKVENQNLFNIGILHTQLEGLTGHEAYAPSTRQELLAQGIDYWALGHVHQRQILHEKPYIIYPGNLQGRHVKEQGLKGFYHVQVDTNKKVTYYFQPVQHIIWLELEVSLEGVESISTVIDKLYDEIGPLREKYSCSIMLQVTLFGQTKLYHQLVDMQTRLEVLVALNQRISTGLHACLWVHRIQFQGRPPLTLESLEMQDSLLGESIRELQEWKQLETIPTVVSDQLAELLNHHRARRYLQFTHEEWKKCLEGIEQQLMLVGLEAEEHED